MKYYLNRAHHFVIEHCFNLRFVTYQNGGLRRLWHKSKDDLSLKVLLTEQ